MVNAKWPSHTDGTCEQIRECENGALFQIGSARMLLPQAIAKDLDGRRLRVSWTQAAAQDALLVLRGRVFRSTKEHCLVSCGGIIVQLPEPLGGDVRIDVCTTKRSRSRSGGSS